MYVAILLCGIRGGEILRHRYMTNFDVIFPKVTKYTVDRLVWFWYKKVEYIFFLGVMMVNLIYFSQK